MTRAFFGVVAVAGLLVTGCSDSKPAAQQSSSSAASASTAPSSSIAPLRKSNYSTGRHTVSFDVDGVTRTAVLVVPADLSHPAPLVFAFHGHGGNGNAFDQRVDIDGLWPDAIVIYPDGLPGHPGLTDPDGSQPGWQVRPGDEGGRDVAFYDTMLATLREKLPVDDDRIFVMGHSNGSGFTALLQLLRGDGIAATATLSGQPGAVLVDNSPARSTFMMMGEADPLVPYDTQRASIPLVEAKLGVDPTTATTDGYLTSERGPGNKELVTYIHPGGHDVPAEVPPLIVDFFKRHALSTG
jgi:polyhydroxybutyrate depolymerase